MRAIVSPEKHACAPRPTDQRHLSLGVSDIVVLLLHCILVEEPWQMLGGFGSAAAAVVESIGLSIVQRA
jgi:hypothetical protein